MKSMSLSGVLSLCIIAVLFAGCNETKPKQAGGSDAVTTQSPVPVQSQTPGAPVGTAPAKPAAPVPPPQASANLLPNGSFSDWTHFPKGLVMGPSPGVELAYRVGREAEGAAALTWSKADSADSTYGYSFKGLKKNVRYLLRFSAENRTGSMINIAVFGETDAGDMVRLLFKRLDTGKGWQDYEFPFVSGECQAARVTVSCATAETTFPAKAAFRSWYIAPELDVPYAWSSAWETTGESLFTVSPVMRGNVTADLALKQEWRESDSVRRVSQLLGTTVKGIKPNTTYQLGFTAQPQGKSTVVVAVYGVNPSNVDESPERLLMVDVPAKGGYVAYKREFNSGSHTAVRIVTACPPRDNAFPVQCSWDNWSLVTAPGK